MPKGCVSKMGEWLRYTCPLWYTEIRSGRTAATTEEGAEIARVQEMPQNGKGLQGGGCLPGTSMQQHQPQVMPTSSLEGCSATALSPVIAFFAATAVLPSARGTGSLAPVVILLLYPFQLRRKSVYTRLAAAPSRHKWPKKWRQNENSHEVWSRNKSRHD